MLERCVNAPRRALIGNWVHDFPDAAYPGPNLDWLHELVRFFDHWLKGIDNGVMDEPALTFFRRDFAPPEPFPASLAGRVAERAVVPGAGRRPRRACGWPRARSPLDGRLTQEAPTRGGVDRFPHRATTGTRTALSWGAGDPPNGLARDLRLDDALLPTYTSAPLADPVEILGFARVELAIEASMPVATVVVRLADVAPDGTTAQVAAGVLNLTHRDSHAAPAPLEPGRVVRRPGPAPGGRLPVRARPPDPPVGRVELLARALAVAVRGRAGDPPRTVAPRPADDPAGRGVAPDAGVQDEPRRSRGARDGIVRADRPGRSSRTSSPAR